MEWFPDFANYRRDGSLLSKELKKLCNYFKGGNKGFDTIITRLQMQTYISKLIG